MAELMEMIDFMVSHTYIMLADQSFKQHIGVPMGTNAGGSIIDSYLFQYEFEFMLQLRKYKYWTLFALFCHTMRYLDDINSINNPYFNLLLYTDMTLQDIKGIYPRQAITLQLIQQGNSVQYMDTILAIANEQQDTHLSNKLFTRSFDKSNDDKFKKLKIIKYPSPHSVIPSSIGLNIIITEAHRLLNLNMDRLNFISAITGVFKKLVNKGFIKAKLLIKLYHFFKRHQSIAIYGMHKFGVLKQIKRRLRTF